MMDAERRFLGNEVARRFLHGYLTINRRRHVIAVPMEAAIVMAIKEVHFTSCRPYVWVQSYEFQQGSRSALLHADYQHFG